MDWEEIQECAVGVEHTTPPVAAVVAAESNDSEEEEVPAPIDRFTFIGLVDENFPTAGSKNEFYVAPAMKATLWNTLSISVPACHAADAFGFRSRTTLKTKRGMIVLKPTLLSQSAAIYTGTMMVGKYQIRAILPVQFLRKHTGCEITSKSTIAVFPTL